MRHIMIYFNTIKKICHRIFEWLSFRTKPDDYDYDYIYLSSRDAENNFIV